MMMFTCFTTPYFLLAIVPAQCVLCLLPSMSLRGMVLPQDAQP
jgi:hypothetical protein